MKTIKPKKLKKGDTIGIIAVSGKIKEYERILRAKAFFEKSGYSVIVSDTCRTFHRYMAGNNDDECIHILHDFFLDKNIDMILCARGGYGTLRLINKIDWDIIRNDKNGIILVQNNEYMCTVDMVMNQMIKEKTKVIYTPIFNPFIKLLIGKVTVITKCFGDLKYEK